MDLFDNDVYFFYFMLTHFSLENVMYNIVYIFQAFILKNWLKLEKIIGKLTKLQHSRNYFGFLVLKILAITCKFLLQYKINKISYNLYKYFLNCVECGHKFNLQPSYL